MSSHVAPIVSELAPERFEHRWKIGLAGHPEICGGACRANVEIAVKECGQRFRQPVDAEKEHNFELEALDVLDVENAHIPALSDDLSPDAGYGAQAIGIERGVESGGDWLDQRLVRHEHGG